jgi:hypothetical protein
LKHFKSSALDLQGCFLGFYKRAWKAQGNKRKRIAPEGHGMNWVNTNQLGWAIKQFNC